MSKQQRCTALWAIWDYRVVWLDDNWSQLEHNPWWQWFYRIKGWLCLLCGRVVKENEDHETVPLGCWNHATRIHSEGQYAIWDEVGVGYGLFQRWYVRLYENAAG